MALRKWPFEGPGRAARKPPFESGPFRGQGWFRGWAIDHFDPRAGRTHGLQIGRRLVAELLDIASYDSARSLAASVGVTPSHHQSGTSVHAHPHISKVGNSDLRGALWWPAISAMRYNPVIRDFTENLRKTNKHNYAIIIAAIRKLLHLVYGVIKNDTPFDPNWSSKSAVTPLTFSTVSETASRTAAYGPHGFEGLGHFGCD